jgi:hypothetical protein
MGSSLKIPGLIKIHFQLIFEVMFPILCGWKSILAETVHIDYSSSFITFRGKV